MSMLDTRLLDLMSSQKPVMNADLCNGIAAIQINNEAENFIHDIWRCVAESFPPQLKYLGYERCTPLQEFNELTRPHKPKRSFELARSDVYMCKYRFSFTNKDGNTVEMRPRYILLPYVSDGGLIYLKGTQYKISPVYGGRAFNIEKGRIFMGTPRARLFFSKMSVSLILNEQVTHADAVWSPLHNMTKPADRSRLVSTLVHYQLAEFGLQGMLKRFYNVDCHVGLNELDALALTGEWMVYRSRQMVMVNKRRTEHSQMDVRIAIPKAQWTTGLNGIIGAVFYIMDNCAGSITVDDLANPELWLRLLSRFIFRTADTERKMYESMCSHMTSIKHYMDPITKTVLAKEGILCRDIFDLLHYLNVNFHDMVITHDVGSMYRMELTTTKHLLYNIYYNIFMCLFDIMKLNGDRITLENVQEAMDNILRRDKILTVAKHGELSPDGIATDCKPYAATCNMISQAKASAANKSQKHNNTMADPALLLHPSQVEVGTYQMMSKADPSGRSKTNPFAYITDRSYISQNPVLEKYVNHLTELLSH